MFYRNWHRENAERTFLCYQRWYCIYIERVLSLCEEFGVRTKTDLVFEFSFASCAMLRSSGDIYVTCVYLSALVNHLRFSA